MKSTTGKWNIGIGLWVMGGFMLYGFYLIYARDFAPGKEVWIANDSISPHFESRLAHVHGNLFAFLNIAFGYLLLRLPVGGTQAKWISGLALTGLLMPIGILTEVYFGFPPYLVLLGATAIVIATVWLGLAVMQIHPESLSMYYFWAGTGTMTVEDEQFPITVGATVIAPAGARRGMQAEKRVIFLAAKPV